MQSIEIANREVRYDNQLRLTYKIKITRTIYTNKLTRKKYTRYKIRIPHELQNLLKNYDKLYFYKKDNMIHITTEEKDKILRSCKIQKQKYYNKMEYSFNLSKKLFNIQDSSYLMWNVLLENNKIIDSIVKLI